MADFPGRSPRRRLKIVAEPRFKAVRIRSEKHREFVRRLPCSVPTCRTTPCSPHHFRSAATSGTGVKPGDEWCTPLCHEHHSEFHQRGWLSFEDKYKINLREIALGVAMVSRAMGLLPKGETEC